MTKTIKRKELNNVIMAIASIIPDNAKNIIGLRCERIGKEINEITKKLNSELAVIHEEHASTDKDQNLLREEVVTTDKHGSSKKENSGGYRYTFKKSQEMKKATQDFWNEDVAIPSNIVKREIHGDLYRKVIENSNFTTLSYLSGVILEIPLDDKGFVDEEWILNFLSAKPKAEQNGQADKKELEGANA